MPAPPTAHVALALVSEAFRQRANAELELRRRVIEARRLGVSWDAIGDAVGGVTRQAAQQRFGVKAG